MRCRYTIQTFKQSSLLIVFTLLFGLSTQAKAEPIFGLTSEGNIISIQTDNPGFLQSAPDITGLEEDEGILAIAFRPATGQLYALGDSSRLYTVDLNSGQATPISEEPFSPELDGDSFDIDFNPTADAIRLVSNTGQNLRLDPESGEVIEADDNLAFGLEDQNVDAEPAIGAIAYTNKIDGATNTTLLGIDTELDVVVLQGDVDAETVSPNTGQLNTLVPLGVETSGPVGMDVSSTSGRIFAALTRAVAEEDENNNDENQNQQVQGSELFTLNLLSNVPSLGRVGPANGNVTITDLASPIFNTNAPILTLIDPNNGETSNPAHLRLRTPRRAIRINGNAIDDVMVSSVEFRRVNRRGVEQPFVNVDGTSPFTLPIRRLRPGRNIVEVRAVDVFGNVSDMGRVVIRRTPRRLR